MKQMIEMQKELTQEIKNIQKTSFTVSTVRAILKKKLKVYSLPIEQQLQVFEKNWYEAKNFEQRSLSAYWLEGLSEKDIVKNSKKILSWADGIDHWAHSDTLCSVFSFAFEKNSKQLLPIYKKWNTHKNPWLRRCSMVGLFYYSRTREVQPTFALAKQMVTRHFTAPEYYVQKAVGWTLREMYNVYPNETIRLIDDNLHRVSSIAWVAATEKLSAEVKNKLLKKRRNLRKLR